MMMNAPGAPLNNNDGSNRSMASPAPISTMNRFYTPSPADRKQETTGGFSADRDILGGRRRPAVHPRTTVFPEACEETAIPSPTAKPKRAVSYEPRELSIPSFFLSPADKEKRQDANDTSAVTVFDECTESVVTTPRKCAAPWRLQPRPQEVVRTVEPFCRYGEGESNFVPPPSTVKRAPSASSGAFETPENQLEAELTSPPPHVPIHRPIFDLRTKLVRVQSAPMHRSNNFSCEKRSATAISETLHMRQNLSTNPFYTGEEEVSRLAVDQERFELPAMPKKSKSWYLNGESPHSTAAKLTFE